MQHDAKVRYMINKTTHQGRLYLDATHWSFVVQNKLGDIIKSIPLDNLPFTFQTLITEGRLQPGWQQHPHCLAFNVSAKHLHNPCPATLSKALHESNTDRDTWLQSYK